MSATNSPRHSGRSRSRDSNAIDLNWAMGRARDWLLGPAPLIANLSLFLFAGLGAVLWRLSQDADTFSLPGWVVIWGVLVAIHAGIVVAYGTVHAWRSPRRGPVFYHAIPEEERTMSRRSVGAAPGAPSVDRPTWQGALAPVTPFPTFGRLESPGSRQFAPTGQADVNAVEATAQLAMTSMDQFDGPWPAAARADSALADVRDVLAQDKPLWHRLRRRGAEPGVPTDLPIDAERSWLSPFPGTPTVSQSTAVEVSSSDEVAGSGTTLAATDPRWPAAEFPAESSGLASRSAEAEQIPSLAAMLRSSNLTSLSDAPIQVRPTQPTAEDQVPAPLPPAPIPFSQQPGAGPVQPGTSALFAAFGIEADGKPPRPAAPGKPSVSGPSEPSRPAAPRDAPRRPGQE